MSKRALDCVELPPKKAFKYRGCVGDVVEVDFNGFKEFPQRDTSVVPAIVLNKQSEKATVQLGGLDSPCINFTKAKPKPRREILDVPYKRIRFLKDSEPPKELKQNQKIQVAWRHNSGEPLAWWNATVQDVVNSKTVRVVYDYNNTKEWKKDVCTVNLKYVRAVQ